MQWNEHSNLEGLHATFSASQYHWINYDVEKMLQVFRSNQAKQLGTELHAHAANCIKYRTKLRGITLYSLDSFMNGDIDEMVNALQIDYQQRLLSEQE